MTVTYSSWACGNNGSFAFDANATDGSGNKMYSYNAGTIEAWISCAPSGMMGRVVKQMAYSLFITGSGYLQSYGWGGSTVTSSSAMTSNVWHHVASVFDDTTGTNNLYIDGVRVASGTGWHIANQAQPLVLGAGSADGIQHMNGNMALVRIWDTCLTDADIASLYTAVVVNPANYPHLTGYWVMTQQSGANIDNLVIGGLNLPGYASSGGSVVLRNPVFATGYFPTVPYISPTNTVLTVSPSDGSVLYHQTLQLSASSNNTAPITYTSDNVGVATVDNNGLVTSVNFGTAYVTAAQAESPFFSGASTTVNVSCINGLANPFPVADASGFQTFLDQDGAYGSFAQNVVLGVNDDTTNTSATVKILFADVAQVPPYSWSRATN